MMKEKLFLYCLLPLILLTSSVNAPDLVAKVVRDDIKNSERCWLGVFKDGTSKNMDDKYRIVSFDLFLLNYRGEPKWHTHIEENEIDFSQYEDVYVESGDLIVIKNVEFIHVKKGKMLRTDKINDRYLVR